VLTIAFKVYTNCLVHSRVLKSTDLVRRKPTFRRTLAKRALLDARSTAKSSYSLSEYVISSGTSRLCSMPAPALCAIASPSKVISGTPAQRASREVVWPALRAVSSASAAAPFAQVCAAHGARAANTSLSAAMPWANACRRRFCAATECILCCMKISTDPGTLRIILAHTWNIDGSIF